MPDREKVIKDLDELYRLIYQSNVDGEILCSLHDAVVLLKEQEPLPVRYVDQGESNPPCIYHSVCRACGGILNYPEKFCKACGRGAIWVPFRKEEADV